jgi:hypothetical protein
MSKTILGFIAVAMLSACAATQDKPAAAARPERAFLTGSNIPKYDKSDINVQLVNPEALQRTNRIDFPMDPRKQ